MAQLTTDFRPDYDAHRKRKRSGCLSLILIVWSIVLGYNVLVSIVVGVGTLMSFCQSRDIIAPHAMDGAAVIQGWGQQSPSDVTWSVLLLGVAEILTVPIVRLILMNGMISLIELVVVGLIWSWKRTGYYLYLACVCVDAALNLTAYGSLSSVAFVEGLAWELPFLAVVSLFVLPNWRYYD